MKTQDTQKISEMWTAIEMVVDAFRELRALGDVEITSATYIGEDKMNIKIEVKM